MPNLNSFIRLGHLVLFTFIILLAAVDIGIGTWLMVHFNRDNNAMSGTIKARVGWVTFTSYWTFVFGVIYLIAFKIAPERNVLTGVLSHIILLTITFIFWTSAAASLTSVLHGGLNCSKIKENFVYCNQHNALMGFAWVDWFLVGLALAICFILLFVSVARGEGISGPVGISEKKTSDAPLTPVPAVIHAPVEDKA